jgi:hypothetical protein
VKKQDRQISNSNLGNPGNLWHGYPSYQASQPPRTKNLTREIPYITAASFLDMNLEVFCPSHLENLLMDMTVDTMDELCPARYPA